MCNGMFPESGRAVRMSVQIAEKLITALRIDEAAALLGGALHRLAAASDLTPFWQADLYGAIGEVYKSLGDNDKYVECLIAASKCLAVKG